MKIAFVMPWHISERGGGAEVQTSYLAEELVHRGFEVSYICQTTENSKINTENRFKGYKIYWLRPSGRFPWMDQKKYYKALVEVNPDFVLQRMSSNVSKVIGQYCKSKNKTFHWFCTDNVVPYKNYHVREFKQNLKSKKVNKIKYLVFYLNALIMDIYRNIGMKSVDVAWSQNAFQKAHILKNFNLETNTIISGHPVLDEPINHEKKQKAQTVLWCANLGSRKRPELFINLADKMKDTDYKFVMVGGHSNQEYVNELFNNKPDNLTVVGKLSFEEALLYFNSASIFVNTSSKGGDGFPNTFIQAWLRGVPTLTLGFDPDSVIETNRLGYNCSNIEELKEKIVQLFDNNGLYIKKSENVKSYAEKHHSVEVMTDNFIKKLIS